MKLLAIALAAAACGNSTKADPASGSGSQAPVATPVVAGSGANNKVDPAKVPAKTGVDFIDDAKLLYRVAACGDQEHGLPEVLGGGDAKRTDAMTHIMASHCKSVLDRIGEFRKTYFEKGRAWFDGVVPKDTKTVVYPFGGGDLLSALVAFPDATEVTTISLELAGDPRRLRTLTPGQVEGSLGALRVEIGGLVSVGSNTSENLSKQQRNDLPGQVSSFLLGLVAGGFEPVSMRYFKINDDGTLHYLEQAEIDAMDKEAKAHRPKSLKHDWMSPSFSEAFANVEIEYRKIGETATRIHRHIGWNLSDDYMNKHPGLLKHLVSKGQVAMLTKGASYLLWSPNFGVIRNYMLDHMTWMLSDSTGIPPTLATGFVQETYGHYNGAFLEGPRGSRHDNAFKALWAKNPHKQLAFRFGYVDMDGAAHLVVTKPKA